MNTTLIESIIASAGALPIGFLGASAVIVLRIPVLADIAAVPYRCIKALANSFGMREVPAWSTVYDSKTGQPLDPAYVRLYDRLGTVVATAVSDLNGRFAFLMPSGAYRLEAQKTHYKFPSERALQKKVDARYGTITRGDWFTVTGQENVIALALPMDAEAGDWNQEEKKRGGYALSFARRNTLRVVLLYGALACWFGAAGFAGIFSVPKALFIALGGVLCAAWISGVGKMTLDTGRVIDSNGRPVANALVTISTAKTNLKVATFRTSLRGRFISLVAQNTYTAHILGVSEDNTPIDFVTEPFEARHGAITKIFRVPK